MESWNDPHHICPPKFEVVIIKGVLEDESPPIGDDSDVSYHWAHVYSYSVDDAASEAMHSIDVDWDDGDVVTVWSREPHRTVWYRFVFRVKYDFNVERL